MSETKPTIYSKLLSAQKSFESAKKSSSNPYFKSKYADLNAVIEACYSALHENGLFISQPLCVQDGQTLITTKVMDEDGAEIVSTIVLTGLESMKPQEVGSYITYMRRYSLSALLGLSTEEDDDGNKANDAKKVATTVNSSGNVRTVTGFEFDKAIKDINASDSMVKLESLVDDLSKRPFSDLQKKSLNTAYQVRREDLSDIAVNKAQG